MKDVVTWEQHRKEVTAAFSAVHGRKRASKQPVAVEAPVVVEPGQLRRDWEQYLKERFGP